MRRRKDSPARVRVRALLAAALIVGMAGSVTATPTHQRVTMAVTFTIGNSPFFLAIERGYFERFGVTPVMVQSTGDSAILLPTLNIGTLDLIGNSLRPAALELVRRGGRIRVVSASTTTATTCTGLALLVSRRFAASHPRTSISDLRGARIGMTSPRQASIGDYLMGEWLKRGGLTLDDVELFRVPIPAMPEALIRGSIDAVQIPEPYLTQTLERGEGIIIARDNLTGPGIPTSLLFIGPTLRSRPGLAARVLAAYLLGVRDYMAPDAKRNPQILQILTKALGQSEETLRKTCWTPVPRDGRIDIAWVEKMQAWMVASGYLSGPVPLDRVIDEQYLREAWRLLEAMGERIR